MALHDLQAPVIANVFVLSGGVARFFHAGRIPGVEVTDELLAVAQKQAASPDKGKAFFSNSPPSNAPLPGASAIAACT